MSNDPSPDLPPDALTAAEIGEALIRALQADYSAVDALARRRVFSWPDGSPVAALATKPEPVSAPTLDSMVEKSWHRFQLENCRLFAARHRKEEWAKTILRFCAEAGVTGSPLRAGAEPVSARPAATSEPVLTADQFAKQYGLTTAEARRILATLPQASVTPDSRVHPTERTSP